MAKKILIKKKKYKALLDNSLQQSTIIAASNSQLSRMVSKDLVMTNELNAMRQQRTATAFEFDCIKTVIKTLQQEYQKLQALNTKLTVELKACQDKLIKVPVKQNNEKSTATSTDTDNVDKADEVGSAATVVSSPVGYGDEPYDRTPVSNLDPTDKPKPRGDTGPL